MGERLQGTLFQPSFNNAVVLEPANLDLSGDAGALVVREAADQLGVIAALANLVDHRNQAQIRFPIADLVLSRVLLLAQGWTDQDDIDALRGDPAFRVAANTGRGQGAVHRPLPSQPTVSRFMGELGLDHNREQLEAALLEVGLRRAREDRHAADRLIVDIDSFPISAHGNQEAAAYNGHYHENCFHPIAAFADTGDLLAIDLRAGNVHTADEAQAFVEPVLRAALARHDDVWLRFDAGFAAGPMFDWLDGLGVHFVTRLRSNATLTDQAASWRTALAARWAASRTPNGAPREATFEFWYQAQKWTRRRRVIAVLVERSDRDGDLFDDMFFLCTNAARPVGTSADLLDIYRRRGSAEARIGEFVNEILPNLSSQTTDVNEATLRLAGLAYQVVHLLRRRIEKHRNEGLSLRRLRERILKAPARCVLHARRIILRIGPTFQRAWEELAIVLRAPALTVAEVAS